MRLARPRPPSRRCGPRGEDWYVPSDHPASVSDKTDQDLREIQGKLKALEEADDSKCYMETDISFHEAIYRATHNTFLISAAQIYLDGVYRRKIFFSLRSVGT
ncbi:MAG: FCD domain-containing protein [Lachnospiraceae bacterium]|nr:FCD domain-containing protein [Lachnospiraceae bacterium]